MNEKHPKCSVCGKVMRAYIYNSLLDSGYSPTLPPKKEYRFDCDNGCSTTNWKILHKDVDTELRLDKRNNIC